MKRIISTNFSDFVNENFSEENKQKSACCDSPLLEDDSCSECGAFETFEGRDEEDELEEEA